jgi:hypothetical protein
MNDDVVLTILAHMKRDAGGKGKAHDDSQVRAHFDDMEKALSIVINSIYLKNGPKDGDRWDMIYHGITIGYGFIRSNGEWICIMDKNLKREYSPICPVMAWIIDVFRSLLNPNDKLTTLTDARAMMNDLCYKNMPWNEVSLVHYGSRANLTLLIHKHDSLTKRETNTNMSDNVPKVSKKKLLGRKREDDGVSNLAKRIKLSSLSLNDTCEEERTNGDVHDASTSDEMEPSVLSKPDMLCGNRELSRIPDWRQLDYCPEIAAFLQRNEKIFKILNVIVDNTTAIISNNKVEDNARAILNCVTGVRKIMVQQDRTVKTHASSYDRFAKEFNSMDNLCGSLSAKMTKLERAQDLLDRDQQNFNQAAAEMEKCRSMMNASAYKVQQASEFMRVMRESPEA